MEELKKQGGIAESEESFIDPQMMPTEGMGERKATQRRKDRVMQILHTLPEKAQTAILESLTEEDMQRYGISKDQDRTELIEITRENPPEDADPFGYQAMQEDQSESMVEGSPAGEGEGGARTPAVRRPERRRRGPAGAAGPAGVRRAAGGCAGRRVRRAARWCSRRPGSTPSPRRRSPAPPARRTSPTIRTGDQARTGPSSRRQDAHPAARPGARAEPRPGRPASRSRARRPSPGTRRRTMPTSTPRRSAAHPARRGRAAERRRRREAVTTEARGRSAAVVPPLLTARPGGRVFPTLPGDLHGEVTRAKFGRPSLRADR